MVSKIRFKNFKLFKEEQTLEIKPITILIGKNNSGKTAVLKLPVMIGESLKGTSNVIEFDNNGIKLGYSYEDLFYNRELNGAPLEFEINDNIKAIITGNIGTGEIKLKSYYFNKTEIDFTKNKIVGLKLENEILPILNYDYIDNYRKKPEFNNRKTFKTEEKIGLNGENSFDIFYNSYNSDKILYNNLSEWYKTNFEGWQIQINEVSGTNIMYEITLKNKNLKPVNILNTGSGILQSFPLIVRSFMPAEKETLIIIEEPESHLHPAAHGNLAERFVDSYKEDSNKRYLIETHSQNFVLRLRRLVAQGKLKPEELAIYYVDFKEEEYLSELKPIKVNLDGSVNWWPDGVFGETIIETRAIMSANVNNLRNVD
jgi:predicted ATPase